MLEADLAAARGEAGKLKGRVTELSRALEAAEAKVESNAKVRAEAAGLIKAAEDQLVQAKAQVRALREEVRESEADLFVRLHGCMFYQSVERIRFYHPRCYVTMVASSLKVKSPTFLCRRSHLFEGLAAIYKCPIYSNGAREACEPGRLGRRCGSLRTV